MGDSLEERNFYSIVPVYSDATLNSFVVKYANVSMVGWRYALPYAVILGTLVAIYEFLYLSNFGFLKRFSFTSGLYNVIAFVMCTFAVDMAYFFYYVAPYCSSDWGNFENLGWSERRRLITIWDYFHDAYGFGNILFISYSIVIGLYFYVNYYAPVKNSDYGAADTKDDFESVQTQYLV